MAGIMRRPLSLTAALALCSLPLTACGSGHEVWQSLREATSPATTVSPGEGTFVSPEDADRTDADSTAEITALMLHSWDTATDRTETTAAIRAKPLMSRQWAANQTEPERNAGGAQWLTAAEHQGYSVPALVPALGDTNRDVAKDKAVRTYNVEWTWTARDGAAVHNTGHRRITIYLEKRNGQWEAVGHQSRDLSATE